MQALRVTRRVKGGERSHPAFPPAVLLIVITHHPD